ncbi:MAG: C39 family peptidase, partial [Lachnospiraceae bacterium]|nr:C39 family peptidase [Lachnospiraceae bacterium]
ALATYSMSHGFYAEGVGTDWLFMTDAAARYGIHATELGLDEAVMKQYLDQGHPIICALRPGDFTTTGHFIMLYGYDEKGFMVNDPNSRERSNRRWDFETLHYQIKNLWGYS